MFFVNNGLGFFFFLSFFVAQSVSIKLVLKKRKHPNKKKMNNCMFCILITQK